MNLQDELLSMQHRIAAIHVQAAEETLERTKLERQQSQLALENTKQAVAHGKQFLRPSNLRHPTVEFDMEKQLWSATLDGVVAHGDTPEMAYDNFDHLWVFGDNK